MNRVVRMRDCKKWQPFFIVVGLFVLLSIGGCKAEPKQEQRISYEWVAQTNAQLWHFRPFPALTSLTEHYRAVAKAPSRNTVLSRADQATMERFFRQEFRNANASYFHLRGQWRLFWSETEAEIGQALEDLRTAMILAPMQPNIQLDLAAGYLHLAAINESFEPLPEAHRLIGKLLLKKPDWFPALFNQGLLLETFGLNFQAIAIWRACLQITTDSDWRHAINQRLARLEKPTHREQWDLLEEQLPQLVTDHQALETALQGHFADVFRYVEESLLPQWQENDQALTLAIPLAELLKGKDPFFFDVIQHLGKQMPEEKNRLSQGFKLLSQVRGPSKNQSFSEEYLMLQAVKQHLGENPYRLRVQYFQADLELRKKNYGSCVALASAVQKAAMENGYANLAGEAGWLVYLANQIQRKNIDPLERLAFLENQFMKAGNLENRVGILNMKAEFLYEIGEFHRSWQFLRQALQHLPAVSKAKRYAQVYVNATRHLFESGHFGLGEHFAIATMAWAERYGDLWTLANAQLWYFRLLLALGKTEAAKKAELQVSQTVKQMKSTQNLKQLKADLLWAKAQFLPASENKISQLESAYRLRRSLKNNTLVPDILSDLFECHLAMNQKHLAQRIIDQTIDILEQDLSRLSPPDRRSFLRHMHRSYNQMAQLSISDGQPDRAFFYAELQRNRYLLEPATTDMRPNASHRVWQPMALQTVQQSLQQGVVVLAYFQSQTGLGVWLIDRHRVAYIPLNVSNHEVSQSLQQLRIWLPKAGVSDQWQAEAERLFQMLVAPIENELGEASLGVILPAGLQGLPFGVLRRPNGSFLAEQHIIAQAPSVSVFTRSLLQGRLVGARFPTHVQLVGATHFSSMHFPLRALSGVEGEIHALQTLWQSEALLGKDAGKKNVLGTLREADVIHWAGHALTKADEPEASQFLLAPEPEQAGSGVLTAREIQSELFCQPQLMILAACDTGIGPLVKSEGEVSLVHPFLKAGVPSVIASFWQVEDVATMDLMVMLHENLRAGVKPAEALVLTQREMIAAGVSPERWAGFGVFGHCEAAEH